MARNLFSRANCAITFVNSLSACKLIRPNKRLKAIGSTCKRTCAITATLIVIISTQPAAYARPLLLPTKVNTQPAISIIIDDLGYKRVSDKRALRLPGSVSYAVLPHTPHAAELAKIANKAGKEILLHLPMESNDHQHLGPGGLTLDMKYNDFKQTILSNLTTLPTAVGINNHMGSLLTQHPGHMQWLMEIISQHPRSLFFIDSFTASSSVAFQLATENWIPSIRRDVFIDDEINRAAIKRQLQKLLRIAKQNGVALGIAHPYAVSLDVLEKWLPQLHKKGFRLIPISRSVEIQTKRSSTWRALLSP